MQTEARVGVVEGGKEKVPGARKLVSSKSQHSQIGTLLAGGLAGAVSKTCTAPLARLTILFQVVYKKMPPRGYPFFHGMVQGMHSDVALKKACILREASRIVREEGFRAFWKGNLVTIVHRLPYSSISFYAFERYRNLLQGILEVEGRQENVSTDIFIRLVGGGLSGLTAASLTYPLDLVRTRLAAQTNVTYYRGILHALRTISCEEGIFGLYKGLGAALLGVGPNLAISFSVYDTARSYWQSQRPNDSTVLASLACGSISGIASSSATFPLDLVRRRIQLEGAGGRSRVYNTGLFGTFGYIVRTEGLRGLYRGILTEYYKVVPTIGIVFMTYEKLKQLLSPPDA